MESDVLTLDDVSCKYGEKWGLRPLSAKIAEGECVTLLGPNGAGKSTLLKLMSQQVTPSSGVILYRDQKLKSLGNTYRSKIGVISHHPFLYEGLSALENLTFYAKLYHLPNPEKLANESLKRVDMNKRMHDPVRTYSRGMLQRTSIARALLNNPELIFLDEPYTGLDRQASYMLTDILKEQIARLATIVLVTHDLDIGYELADKILILSKGSCKYYDGKHTSRAEFERFYLKQVESSNV